MSVSWDYYDRKDFDEANSKYLPMIGEGETMATQAVTAVNKLVYKYYNDGDVYDNTYELKGWCNDLSSYANWLLENVDGAAKILVGIKKCKCYEDYEDLLKAIADLVLGNPEMLAEFEMKPKTGSVYDCDGVFKFVEDDGDEEWW